MDRLVVIAGGKLVREGTLEELTTEGGTRVTAEDPAALITALDRHGIAHERRRGGLDVSLAPADMGRLALREQIVLTSLGASDGGLEEIFFALTGQTSAPAVDPTVQAAPPAQPDPTAAEIR